MHGFLYLGILNVKNGIPIANFTNLLLEKDNTNHNYNKILLDEGLTYVDIKNAQEISPLKIEVKHISYPLFYYFFKGQQVLLMIVSRIQYKNLQNIMDLAIRDIDVEIDLHEEEFKDELKEDLKEKIKKEQDLMNDQFTVIISRHFFSFLFPDFLIPKIISKKDISIFLESDVNLQKFSKLVEFCDGITDLSEIYKNFNEDKEKLYFIFFQLWVKNRIYFRIKYYDWDILEKKPNASNFMIDGTPENLKIIQKFNSNKIVRVLQLIDSEKTFKSLSKELDLTSTKLITYITELIRLDLVKKISPLLDINHVSEDLIPLLTMQGFSKTDFVIFRKLEEFSTQKSSLDDLALNIGISPNRIKYLMDRYKTARRIIT